jgi:hypothetical protein
MLEVRAVADTDVIFQDQATGPAPAAGADRPQESFEGRLYGFRLEMGRDCNGMRMQARRNGFVTEKAAMVEYGRLCR